MSNLIGEKLLLDPALLAAAAVDNGTGWHADVIRWECDLDAALREAVSLGHRNITHYLLAKGVDPAVDNSSILTLPGVERDLELLKVLYYYGADLSIHGPGLMREAIVYSRGPTVAFLAQCGVCVDHEDSVMSAIRHGCYSSLREVLRYGVSPRSRYLEYACSYNRVDIVKLLLRYGADPDSSEGLPIYNACRDGHIEVVRLLARHGAGIRNDVNDCLWAAIREQRTDVVMYLLSHRTSMWSGIWCDMHLAITTWRVLLCR